jgi:hypothetical protein
MADVTIAQLTAGTPAGSSLVPYSTGTVTLGAPVSAMFQTTNKVYFNASNDGVTSFQHLITGATSASFIMADDANKEYLGPILNTKNAPLLELRGTAFNFSEPRINFTEKGNVMGSIIVKNYGGNTGAFHFCTNNTNFAANSAVPRMTISANGNVGISTTTPACTLDMYGDVVAQNGIGTRTNSFTLSASVKKRITVSLTNYCYVKFKLYALRTNGGDNVVWWEGVLNNNFGVAYTNTMSERRISNQISYTLQSVNGPAFPNENTAPCLWHFDFNSTPSVGFGHYDCSYLFTSPRVTGISVVESTWT